jgi:predicted nucleic acid-binding protein
MAQAEFRFYATLNDFLPPAWRGRSLLHRTAEHVSVKQAIEALGVPHPEVALLLADCTPVDFNHSVHDGMRISAYPKLQRWGLDWLRPPPALRLLTDAHLGRLAAYLRLLGLDTRHCERETDAQIAALAQAEGRIVLTRDRALLMHRNIVHGHYLRSLAPL